jgi:hypothetical protein
MRKTLALLAFLPLAACGGTTYATFDIDPATGAVSGKIVDGKDREGAELIVTLPGGAGIEFRSTGSNGSVGQARVLDTIDGAIAKIPAP